MIAELFFLPSTAECTAAGRGMEQSPKCRVLMVQGLGMAWDQGC